MTGVSGTGQSQLVRERPYEERLAYTGQIVDADVAVPLDWRNLPAIGRSANALFPAGTREVVGRVEGGAFRPLLGPGDAPLPDRTWISTQGVSVVRDGSVGIVLDTNRGPGAFLWKGGSYSLVAEPQRTTTSSGASIFNLCCGRMAAGENGVIAGWGGWTDGRDNHWGVLLFRQGSSTAEVVLEQGVSIPGGGHAGNPWDMVVDASARVTLVVPLDVGAFSILLWDKGRLTPLARSGDPGPQGLTLTAYARIAVAGDSSYALLQYGNNQVWEIVEFSPSGRRVVDTGFFRGDILSANARGDVLYDLAGGSDTLVVKRRDGSTSKIFDSSVRSASGFWWAEVYGASLTDEGDVWFAARASDAVSSRIGLFRSSRAAPR